MEGAQGSVVPKKADREERLQERQAGGCQPKTVGTASRVGRPRNSREFQKKTRGSIAAFHKGNPQVPSKSLRVLSSGEGLTRKTGGVMDH